MPRVARFNVTPVKSTALHHPDEIELGPRGATGDRAFFFVDANGKRFPGTAKGSLIPIRATYDPGREWLTLRMPDGVEVAGSALADGRALEVDFYGRPVAAHVIEGDFGDALSTHAGEEVLLARPDEPGEALDVRPVTLVSLESVAELARQGGHEGELASGRFRMTIEIEGVDGPHAEDAWRSRRVRVGSAMLQVGDQVPRCVVTTLDPSTGVRDFPTLPTCT